ncbi:hypothetical protein ACFQ4C_07210 [Larkinella insperata]|uniref:Uncharacterized protein n=1 Tax=Larkinella insperata TaxID=332158 RepID=A0ABW3Q3C2_9BACT
MKINFNQIDIPFQVGQDVFIHQPLHYWGENRQLTVPHFSGVIQSIKVCFNPKSRFLKTESQAFTLLIDLIKYEILPHSHFNPFGQVQIVDFVASSKLFQSEAALLESTRTESSPYYPYYASKAVPV